MPKDVNLEEIGESLLKIARQKRVDEAEVYLSSNRVLTIRIVNNAVFEAKSVHDIGAGIRVIKGNMLGFSSTSDLSPQSLERAITSALQVSRARKVPSSYSFPDPAKPPEVTGLYDRNIGELPVEEAVELAYEMVDSSLNFNPKIVDNAGVLNLIEYHVVIMNTHDLTAFNDGTFFEASLTATAKDGEGKSEGAESIAGRKLDDFKPKDVGVKAAEMAVQCLKTEPLKEGTYTLILDYEPSSNITSYISMLLSPMVAKLYYPLFIDKIGKQVGSPQLSIIDNQLMPGGIGSSPIDDEGTPSRQIILMEEGVLKTFVYDRFYGAMDGKQTTGNALRISFAVGVSQFPGKNYNSEPIPLARNPHIKPGDWKADEIIEDTKNGLLARRFHYTRLTNPTRGDFTSVLRTGLFIVKDGEVRNPVRKSRLVDNLFNLVKNVDAISDELRVGGSWGEYLHTPIIRTKARISSLT